MVLNYHFPIMPRYFYLTFENSYVTGRIVEGTDPELERAHLQVLVLSFFTCKAKEQPEMISR
jgi:hypothetical protein